MFVFLQVGACTSRAPWQSQTKWLLETFATIYPNVILEVYLIVFQFSSSTKLKISVLWILHVCFILFIARILHTFTTISI
jgi:hypothetical protein